MRIRNKSLLAALICFSAFACHKNEIPDKSASPNPVLEISQEAVGLRDTTGKTLFFRLYDNGTVEFEYPDDKKKTAGESISRAEEINTLKRAEISRERFQEISSLLDSVEFQKIQARYERKCCCMDAFVNFKISFKYNDQQTDTVLHNYCDVGELKNPKTDRAGEVPKVLSELMILADNTRWKYYPG